MGYPLEGRRVLVTGGSSGIGAGLAVACARAGATVAVAARREDRLRRVVDACERHTPGAALAVTDLSDPDAVDDLAGWAASDFGGVDMLVNCAGIPMRRHVRRLDPATVESVLQVNFLAAVRLTLALLPPMVERGEGRIVNVSSVAATLSSPGEAAYDASKAALTAFSEAMAVDLWDTGVKVLVVYPGMVDTELATAAGNDPPSQAVEPVAVDEVVAAVLDALDRDAVEVYVPGFFAELAAGKAANVPGFLSGAAEFVRGGGATVPAV